MYLFGITIFVSAFLLFAVQPMMGKFVLPAYGGGAGVWTVVLLFFQLMLLAGYAYAHFLRIRVKEHLQWKTHGALLLLSFIFLPLIPDFNSWVHHFEYPPLQILLLLTVTVGLPYFLLSATGPLMQSQFAAVYPNKSPYSLYSLSNFASLLAILAYPILVEPSFGRSVQAWAWSGVYVIFVLTSLLLMWSTRNNASVANDIKENGEIVHIDKLLWIGLSACGSLLLHGTTTQLSFEVAPIPFVWLLPIGLYLLTFIISFSGINIYKRWLFIPVWILFYLCIYYTEISDSRTSLSWQVFIYSGGLFLGAWIMHSELFNQRPNHSKLTTFYLYVAVGGVLGGIISALVAPLCLNQLLEVHLSYLFGLIILGIAFLNRRKADDSGFIHLSTVSIFILIIVSSISLYHLISKDDERVLYQSRNFHGVISVLREPFSFAGKGRILTDKTALYHNGTTHAYQFNDEKLRTHPTCYYSKVSGLGITMKYFPKLNNRRIGAIGLGAGTVSAYARGGDHFEYFEINNDIIEVADKYFTYIKDSPADNVFHFGDARNILEREEHLNFDILVVDAFNGDSIPENLITKEAFECYLKHMSKNGVIAFHLTNDYFDLKPVVAAIAQELNLYTRYTNNRSRLSHGISVSDWCLLSRVDEFLNSEIINARSIPYNKPDDAVLWTDDYNSLWPLFQINYPTKGILEIMKRDFEKLMNKSTPQ